MTAGCSAVVPGRAYPVGASQERSVAPAADAPRDGRSGAVDLCATLTPEQLAQVGLAGATARSIGDPMPACQCKVRGAFVPVMLMLMPGADLDALTAHRSAGTTYRETEVAGVRAVEVRSAAEGDTCGLIVDLDPAPLQVLGTGGCDQGRRMLEMVIPNLPARRPDRRVRDASAGPARSAGARPAPRACR